MNNGVSFRWTADPPAWAAYVSSVIIVDRGTEVRLSIDMRAKYLQPASAEVDGHAIRVSFYTTNFEEEGRPIWPEDLGPWPEDQSPAVVVDFGRDISDLEVRSFTGGRYTVDVIALRPVPADEWLGAHGPETPTE